MSTTAPNSNSINVDTTTETVELQFVDDRGNQTTPPPGAAVTFSDPNGVVTFQVATDNPFRATLVPTGSPGTAQLTAQVSGFNGPDGNAVPNPDPVSVQVNPGAAVGERLVVSDSAPAQPAPTTPAPTTPDPTPAPAPDPGTAPPTDPSTPSAPTDPSTPTPTPDTTAPATTTPTTTSTDTDQLDRSVYTHASGPVSNDPNWPDSGYVTVDGNNSPLYYFSGDSAPGQANGNGADGGAWEFYTGPIQLAA